LAVGMKTIEVRVEEEEGEADVGRVAQGWTEVVVNMFGV